MANRTYDIVVFGATGFTGGLTAEYLARHAPEKLRWALAGRSRSKLEAVRQHLAAINPALSALPLLEADVGDAKSLRTVAESARVIITTVGPYLLHGEPLVAACAAAGTDYVDLTGEPEFVDRMWLSYHEQAKRSGARIIHCCGFDSIPHDLGVLFTVQQLPENVPLRIEGFVRAGGTFSAGTFHSAITAMSRLREAGRVLKERISREGRPQGRRIGSAGKRVHFEKAADGWAVPMPTIDPQIVKRSAADLDRYGPDFRYSHFMLLKKLSQVAMISSGVGAMLALSQLPVTRRWLMSQKTSGEGPSEEKRARSWFKVRFIGEGGGRHVITEVSGGDPGYGETSKMLAESALCLACDDLPKRSGQLTTAVAMGEPLMKRLQAAGIEFKVIESK